MDHKHYTCKAGILDHRPFKFSKSAQCCAGRNTVPYMIATNLPVLCLRQSTHDPATNNDDKSTLPATLRFSYHW